MNTPPQQVKLRPHHLLCTLCFEGRGYSPDFVENYKEIAKAIETNPDLLIEIVGQTDDVCAPCPHKRDKLCQMQDKIDKIDAKHSRLLEIKAGDILSWNEALHKMKTLVTLPKFHEACETCQWKPYGICENKIRKL